MGFGEAVEHLGDEVWLKEAGHGGHVLERYVLYPGLSPFSLLSPGCHEVKHHSAFPPDTNQNELPCPGPRNNGSKSSRTKAFPPSSWFSQVFSHCDGM